MGLKLKNLTEMALFLFLNCSEDLKQAIKPWVPIGLGYNWLTDVFQERMDTWLK